MLNMSFDINRNTFKFLDFYKKYRNSKGEKIVKFKNLGFSSLNI